MVPEFSGTTTGTYDMGGVRIDRRGDMFTYAFTVTGVTAGTIYFEHSFTTYTNVTRQRICVAVPKAFRWFDRFRKKLKPRVIVESLDIKAPVKMMTACSITQKKHQKRKHFLLKIRKS